MNVLVSISRSLLWSGLQHVVRAISPRPIIPILSGIHVQADEAGLTLTASDHSILLRYRLDAANRLDGLDNEPSKDAAYIERRGTVVIPARYWLDITRHLPDGIVTIETLDHYRVRISAGKAVYRLGGMDPAMFPEMRPIESRATAKLHLPNDRLHKLIKQVSFAASSSEARPVLTGVACHVTDKQLTMIATDGVRLASRALQLVEDTVMSLNHSPSVDEELNIVVPAKHLNDWAKIAADKQEPTAIHADRHAVQFDTGRLAMQTIVLEGAFPPIDKLMASSDSFITEVTADTGQLLAALERAVLVAGDSCIVIMQAMSAQAVTLVASTAEIGDIREEVELAALIGELFSISFNARYMADILSAIDEAQVRIRMSGKWSPIIVLPAADETSIYALTPIRTRG